MTMGVRPHTQRWALICQDCWQAVNPDDYCPELSKYGTCSVCQEPFTLVLSVHPEVARDATRVLQGRSASA